MVSMCEGVANSSPVDEDGVVLKDIELIKDGVAQNMFGSYKFGYYLGIDKPTGNLPVVVVKEGKEALVANIKKNGNK
jgi:hypothetical protein